GERALSRRAQLRPEGSGAGAIRGAHRTAALAIQRARMSALNGVLDSVPSVSLGEIETSAALMSRVDRKYLVPRVLLAQILQPLDALAIPHCDRLHHFRYRTVYLDSLDFDFYRQHVQQRRHRFKVRTRTYCDSGACLLEVKSKGLRGRTVK